MISIAESRPPYVTFELRAEEDRDASIAAGCYTAKDVAYAIVTPQGSKDRIERVVEDWFSTLEQQSREGRIPVEWLQSYRRMYKSWQEGNEIPLEGTDIRNWPAVSPAQVKMLGEARIRTVEDLATANEETLNRLGMGGRALKARAIEWLGAAKGTGVAAEAAAALKVENADLRARNEELETRLARLERMLEPQTAAKVEKL